MIFNLSAEIGDLLAQNNNSGSLPVEAERSLKSNSIADETQSCKKSRLDDM